MSSTEGTNFFRGDTFTKWRIGANVITHRRTRKCIRDLVLIADRKQPLSRVLDCPCGAGRMIDLLLDWKVTAADITPRRLEDVKRYFPDKGIEIHECDVFSMPFADESFELVLNCLLIQHIEEIRLPALFQELGRVSSRWIVATYPSSYSLVNLYRIFGGKRQTRLKPRQFRKLVNAAGLSIVAERRVLPFLAAGKVVLLEKKS